MADLAEKVKQAQAGFSSAAPQPVAGNPCPPPQVVAQAAPAPAAPSPTAVAAAPAPQPAESKPEQVTSKKAWVKIKLVDEENKPVAGVRYRIQPPGLAPAKEGKTDFNGEGSYYELDPGTCEVSFPDLDMNSWEKI